MEKDIRQKLFTYCEKRGNCIGCNAISVCGSKCKVLGLKFKVGGKYLLDDIFINKVNKLL